MKTSNYKNFGIDRLNKYLTMSISSDAGRSVEYTGESMIELSMPEKIKDLYEYYKGINDSEENDRYYVEEYYKQVLSKLFPDEVYDKLKYYVVLSNEDPMELSSRNILIEWLKIFLNVDIEEIKYDDVKGTEVIERIKGLDKLLETVIRENTPNMRGFHSLRALFLFEKGEELELLARQLMDIDNEKNCDSYYQTAAFLRSEADDVEEEYVNSHPELKLKRN